MPSTPAIPAATFSAARGAAGLIQTDGDGLHANIANPAWALLAFLLLMTLPYLVPLAYMDLVKVATPEQHLAVCLAFGGGLASAYALYAAVGLPQGSRPVPLDPAMAGAMQRATAALVWLGVTANLALLAWCVPHYTGTVFSMKRAMADLGGVNILSQSYLFALGPFLYLSIRLGRPWRRTILWLGAVLTLRALLLAERLALLEFAVPLLVLLVLLGRVRVPLGRLLALAAAVPALFVVGELFRSFSAKFVRDSGWSHLEFGFILRWNLERLALYYADVTNKLHFMLQERYFHISDHWRDGAVGMAARLGLVAGEPEVSPLSTVIRDWGVGTPEMTNLGGPAILLADFGWWGVAVFAGFVALLFATHARASHGRLLSLAVYPVLFLSVIELPRIVYLTESRAIFPLLLFLAAYLGATLLAGTARRGPAGL